MNLKALTWLLNAMFLVLAGNRPSFVLHLSPLLLSYRSKSQHISMLCHPPHPEHLAHISIAIWHIPSAPIMSGNIDQNRWRTDQNYTALSLSECRANAGVTNSVMWLLPLQISVQMSPKSEITHSDWVHALWLSVYEYKLWRVASGWILHVIIVDKETSLYLMNLMIDFHVCHHFISLLALINSRTCSEILLQGLVWQWSEW